ncbi:hypothetical protein COCCADRAFT_28788 [Bipolaris zeicola 26-R-13]|uniref:Zn(2)-C6 fungal-type domain-containing protein n=1 Tax=Cochliobolus carbonum (strain 26-R-13) TaxID=930089 RepID=W6XX24_COCC2|nr:uncharacterized protein COCCADRAFT_28788 [Bipolaris zeicola 26-R-13]EUC30313.1 hypothetical protein COCCADRAFT_28788 [Bipolaris zeicola 26-R-13]
MNSHPSPIQHMDMERRSSSPKRKKVRQKYAPKACVLCRRSKLKCSGENPCQRCVDNGKRCFFSEDQTAAEALQHLSRPTPSLQAQSSTTSGNGSSNSRRSLLPHDETARRTSDASARGMTMEARMARVEAMMEALMRDRGLTMTPMGSVERDDGASDGFRGGDAAAFPIPPLDPINPALAFMGQSALFSQEPSNPTSSTISGPESSFIVETPHLVHLGGRSMSFPSPAEYQQYLMSFFTDIHLSHPCIDETDFRSRGEQMLANAAIQPEERHFLALNYIVFACCDALLNVSPLDASKPAGWRWSEIADDLLDKKSLVSGNGDLTLIQCVLFQALYYTFIDMPGPAYSSIGIAGRLVFQHSLHQQSTWADITTQQAYERICVFWNVFIADRFISLACGRPYSIHEADIQVELPMELFNRAMLTMQLDLEQDPRIFMNQYLHYMILWARYVGCSMEGRSSDGQAQEAIDAQITQFLDHDLPELRVSYMQTGSGVESPIKAFLVQKKTDLVLWGFRPVITSLQYNENHAAHFSHLAGSTVSRMTAFAQDARSPFSLRHSMITSLSNALLVLCSLLGRNGSPRNQTDIDSFRHVVALLNDLAYSQPYAKRVLTDFESILPVIEGVIEGKDVPTNISDLIPYKASCPRIRSSQVAPSFGQSTGSGKNFAAGNGHTSNGSEAGHGILWL